MGSRKKKSSNFHHLLPFWKYPRNSLWRHHFKKIFPKVSTKLTHNPLMESESPDRDEFARLIKIILMQIIKKTRVSKETSNGSLKWKHESENCKTEARRILWSATSWSRPGVYRLVKIFSPALSQCIRKQLIVFMAPTLNA